jgi:hypothetical protein
MQTLRKVNLASNTDQSCHILAVIPSLHHCHQRNQSTHSSCDILACRVRKINDICEKNAFVETGVCYFSYLIGLDVHLLHKKFVLANQIAAEIPLQRSQTFLSISFHISYIENCLKYKL